MRRGSRYNLREFLLKPRFLHEIVKHYGVSKKTAIFHLREAMKSGQLLVSETPVFQTIRDSSGNLKKLKGFLYVYQGSPILVDKDMKFSVPNTNNSKHGLPTASHTGFSKPIDMSTSSDFEPRSLSRLASTEKAKSERTASLKAYHSPISKLNASSVKISSVDHTSRLLPSRHYSVTEPAALANAEKIRLFEALLKEPLPFLDLHSQFGVSRQTITRLVNRGLLMEAWGSEGVGLRFKLTSKGKAFLRQLEEVSKYKPRISKRPLTRLKQRTVV